MTAIHDDHDQPHFLSLQQLYTLRLIAIVCEIGVIVVATRLLSVALPVAPLSFIIAVHALINLFAWWQLRHKHRLTDQQVFFQLALDTLVLATLLYFTGGSTNPFVSLFLLPLVIVAAILPRHFAWAMALLTIACYSILMRYYHPLPPVSSTHGVDFDLHVMGMWFGFMLSVGLIIFFVVRMASHLRERDHTLSQAREQALRDQHLVTLGTLATGAAHQLGTPLSTMAVIASELGHDHPEDSDITDKAVLLRQQIDRCKTILSEMTAETGQARAEDGHAVAIDEYLRSVVQHVRDVRPGSHIQCQLDGQRPAPQILADRTLAQALSNLLDNACDASPRAVSMRGNWRADHLQLIIDDRGDGLDQTIKDKLGTPFLTTKSEGHGLGLYLAKAIINRFQGTLVLAGRPQGGTRVVVELPLQTILIDPS